MVLTRMAAAYDHERFVVVRYMHRGQTCLRKHLFMKDENSLK